MRQGTDLNHAHLIVLFTFNMSVFLDTVAAYSLLEPPMQTKLHAQNFALLVVAAAIVLGGDYFVRDLFHAIQSKADASEVQILRERVAKLEQKQPAVVTTGFNVTPLPTPEEFEPTTVLGKRRLTLSTVRGPVKESVEDADAEKDKDKDNGKFVLLTSASPVDAAKSDFKLLGPGPHD